MELFLSFIVMLKLWTRRSDKIRNSKIKMHCIKDCCHSLRGNLRLSEQSGTGSAQFRPVSHDPASVYIRNSACTCTYGTRSCAIRSLLVLTLQ